jgi:hypothetical protein
VLDLAQHSLGYVVSRQWIGFRQHVVFPIYER